MPNGTAPLPCRQGQTVGTSHADAAWKRMDFVQEAARSCNMCEQLLVLPCQAGDRVEERRAESMTRSISSGTKRQRTALLCCLVGDAKIGNLMFVLSLILLWFGRQPAIETGLRVGSQNVHGISHGTVVAGQVPLAAALTPRRNRETPLEALPVTLLHPWPSSAIPGRWPWPALLAASSSPLKRDL